MMTTLDPMLAMLELKQLVPNIKYDLAYASKSNFTKHRLYPKKLRSTYLRKEPALALSKIAEQLAEKGLGIVVWDAYRPYAVTERFWKLIHDERYVANPAKGSGHNRGIAIDLTLYELSSGNLIDMPTGFDDFSETAHHGYQQISEIKLKNRELLKDMMEKNGFIKFETEWWHYSWPSPSTYDVLNIPFSRLK
jgi:D-alanyl-D-alanine dipeptidase